MTVLTKIRTFQLLTICFGLTVFVNSQGFSFAADKNPAAKQENSSSNNLKSKEFNEKGVAAVSSGDFVRAQDLFQQALNFDQGNITAAYNLAGLLIADTKYDRAISVLSSFSKAQVKDSELYSRLGDAYFAKKDIENAITNYEKALSFKPDLLEPYLRLAALYSLKNDTQKAEAALIKISQLDPNNVENLANLSSILLANGKIQEAISTAKRGLAISPTSRLYVSLGTIYETQKDFKNALIAFRRAKDLGDSNPELAEKIAVIEALANRKSN